MSKKNATVGKHYRNRAKTLCLNMIVKNESKNMVRVLDSLKTIVDFISIVDTGSTDDTPLIIEQWCLNTKIPYKIHHEEFKNFSHNRTHSAKMAKESFPQADYLLLSDADFVWEVNSLFNKKLLFAHEFQVTQKHGDLYYTNTRLLRNDVDWECMGVTHEYWQIVNNGKIKDLPYQRTLMKTLKINDMEDGGCKEHKYTRDKKLLLEGLEAPDTGLHIRYLFYLGQTYRCLGEYENSNIFFQKRIDKEGWEEEVYYSKYQIGNNLKSLYEISEKLVALVAILSGTEEFTQQEQDWIRNNSPDIKAQSTIEWLEQHNPEGKTLEEVDLSNLRSKRDKLFEDMISTWLDAHKYRPTRGEALYAATMMLRDKRHYQRAYDLAHIGKTLTRPDDSLFLEEKAYSWGFDWEISIITCYLPDKLSEGQEATNSLLEREDLPDWVRRQVEANAKHYI